jgi:hypothetical protein
MDADPNAPVAPSGQEGPSPAPAPPAPPTPAAPAVEAKPVAAPSATTTPSPAEKSTGPRTETAALSETDGLLAGAGYTLTPGVSALPLKPDFVFSGYLQGQYESHQDSSDQLRQGGALLNQNRFLLRRGRFKIARDWEWAQVLLEIDGNTTRGPAIRLQKAEASLIYGRSKDRDQPPLAQLTIGQFDLPFGFEVPYVPKVRWFMERTQASRALFPGEPDVGVRFSGGYSFARYAIAITNGEPLDEKSGLQLQDPNANKDLTARFGAEAKATRSIVVAGGVSYNRGKGFSPGTDATKNAAGWTDTNGDGKVQITELSGQPSQTAKVSKNFERWGVGADLELLLKTGIGWSMLYGEAVLATNLDRGLFVANPNDPTGPGIDLRELGYYIAFTQEITKYGVVGFRYDVYDPNSDVTDTRRGKILPSSQKITTYSPLAGLVLPGRARLLFQYDIIKDFLARNTLGVPVDFKNNQWTLRLQVNL